MSTENAGHIYFAKAVHIDYIHSAETVYNY